MTLDKYCYHCRTIKPYIIKAVYANSTPYAVDLAGKPWSGKRCPECNIYRPAKEKRFGEVSCPTCSTTFMQKSSTHKYCSRKCALPIRPPRKPKAPKPLRQTEHKVNCLICSIEFTTKRNKRYCSSSCYETSKYVPRFCHLCKVQLPKGRHRCECEKIKPVVERLCITCQKPAKRKYCSKVCRPKKRYKAS